MATHILGISAFYHDSAAALVSDGEIMAAAEEERFSRKKHDAGFPLKAIEYCLKSQGLKVGDLAAITFYDKPLLKFERLLETYLAFAPRGLGSFVTAMPSWLKDKLYLKQTMKKSLANLASLKISELPPLYFAEHHQSHAASAFYPSPYQEAAVLCLDGVGEWATTSAWLGRGNELQPLWEIHFPHSLGLLYSAFTYYCGFKVNSGEYKLMGLAPYGEPEFVDLILNNLVELKEDGSFRLNMSYFNYATGLTMTNKKFDKLFGGPPRKKETQISQREMNIAASIQVVTEEIVLNLANDLRQETGQQNLCMAGGVALNCVANGRLLREGKFKNIFVQPAAGDAGGALGCALATWFHEFKHPREIKKNQKHDFLKVSYLGPVDSDEDVTSFFESVGAQFTKLGEAALLNRTAKVLAEGRVVGWYNGPMEFGPRALGARSILADPRDPGMQSKLNLKIKFRESFRPFAPAVLAEDAGKYFKIKGPSPYMVFTAPVKKAKRLKIPAVTHVDGSARIQTVHRETNPRFYKLLQTFKKKTGCPVLVNTSFNVRGEPIVCTVEDAYRCFMKTGLDYLVVNNFFLAKESQPASNVDLNDQGEVDLD